jgi:hypothetical protein
MTIKDAADLFADEGEEAREILDALKDEAQDVLDLVLAEAPNNSLRESYQYVREQVFPLIRRLEDEGEQNTTLKDVAGKLKFRVEDLRQSFAKFVEQSRPEQEQDEGDQADLAPEPDTERYQDAMELLMSQHFLGLFVRYMGMLGHVGDYVAKHLALLCALSALTGRLIQPSTHAQSSAGKNALWDAVISFLPPEMVVRRTGLSAKALFRTSVDLSHKVLYIQEVVGSEEADYTIRTLQSDGRLVYEATEKASDRPMHNVVYEVEGPTVIVQTTTKDHLHPENETRVFPIFVDESRRQTRRIIDSYLEEAEDGGVDPGEQKRILGRFRDAIRLLEPGIVIIPYARRIQIPDEPVRIRRDARRLLDLVRVITWVHQYQRARDERGRIVATEDDFRKALGLASKSLLSAWKSLTPAEEDVLRAIKELTEAKRRKGFGRKDLEVQGREDRRVQDALKSLHSNGYLDCDGRRGPQGYKYTLVRESRESALGISLRPARQEGEDVSAGANVDVQRDPAQSGQGDNEEDEEEREPRDIARNDERAIENDDLQVKEAIALSRGGETEEDYLEGESDVDEEEEEPDYLEELTVSGWFRAETDFPAKTSPAEEQAGEDPVARRLRHEVGIYKPPDWWKDNLNEEPLTPLALTAEDVFNLGPEGQGEGNQPAASWPATPEEMAERLKQVIPLLGSDVQRFWDPGLSWWYEMKLINQPDKEKHCKEAYLHAELWRNEETGQEIWVLVALKEGWRVPDTAIEWAVWWRTTHSHPMNDFPDVLFGDLE